MKRFFLVLTAMFGIAAAAAAQSRSLGVRAGYGAELSYQHTLSAEKFGELDLGWSVNAFRVSAAYDFQIAPVGPLNFYAGPQASLGFATVDDTSTVSLGVGAQVGLEYCFDAIPLQLSLDWKPTFYFVPATSFGWEGLALGIRYLF